MDYGWLVSGTTKKHSYQNTFISRTIQLDPRKSNTKKKGDEKKLGRRDRAREKENCPEEYNGKKEIKKLYAFLHMISGLSLVV